MVWACIDGLMGVLMRGSTLMIKRMAMGYTLGQILGNTQGGGSEESSMELVHTMYLNRN